MDKFRAAREDVAKCKDERVGTPGLYVSFSIER